MDSRHDVLILCPGAAQSQMSLEAIFDPSTAPPVYHRCPLLFRLHAGVAQGSGRIKALPLHWNSSMGDGFSVCFVLHLLP